MLTVLYEIGVAKSLLTTAEDKMTRSFLSDDTDIQNRVRLGLPYSQYQTEVTTGLQYSRLVYQQSTVVYSQTRLLQSSITLVGLLQSSVVRSRLFLATTYGSSLATILYYGVKGRHYCTLQMLAVTMSGRWTTLFNFTVRIPEEPKVHCTVTVILYSI